MCAFICDSWIESNEYVNVVVLRLFLMIVVYDGD